MTGTATVQSVVDERARWMGAAAASAKTVVVVSSDVVVRERLRKQLLGMRWTVQEATGGAEALVRLEEQVPAAVLLDSWLPDLEAGEFARQLRSQYPGMDLLHLDGTPGEGAPRSARRNELLHALREIQQDGPLNGPAWTSAPLSIPPAAMMERRVTTGVVSAVNERRSMGAAGASANLAEPVYALPEMVGDTEPMRELGRMVRLVAPRTATVLIEG